MGVTKEEIATWDDYKVQDSFATILVFYGMLYNEMEKRGLFANPKK